VDELDKNPVIRETIGTSVALVVVTGATVVGYRLAKDRFGISGLGQYTFVLQLASVLVALLRLGLGVGIARYVALSEAAGDTERAKSYVLAGLMISIGTSIVALVALNLKPSYIAGLALGGSEQAWGVFPATLLSITLVVAVVPASYYRGHLQLGVHNLITALVQGVSTMIAFWAPYSNTISRVILWRSLFNLAVGGVFLGPFVKSLFVRKACLREEISELIKYGVVRMPQGFGVSGLKSFGPMAASHFTSLSEAGFLALGMRLIGMIETALAPLGTVMLPRISRSLAANEPRMVGSKLLPLVEATLDISIFACAQIIVHLGLLIALWFGEDTLEAVPAIRPLMLIIPFAAVYITLRSWLDAASVRALNMRNIVLSLGVLIASFAVLWLLPSGNIGALMIEIPIVLSWVTLGASTMLTMGGLYRVRLPSPVWPLVVSAVLVLPFVLVGSVSRLGFVAIFVAAASLLASFALFMVSMHLCGRSWPALIMEGVRSSYGQATENLRL
jgi:O-antigen/teichoic acid export membrane protein